MTSSPNMWTWVGVGTLLIFLLCLSLIWLCKLFNIFPTHRLDLSPFSNIKRGRRLRNLTVTLKREVTQINEFAETRSLSPSSMHSYLRDSTQFETNEDQDISMQKFENSIDTHYTQHYEYIRSNLTTSDQMCKSSHNPKSLYDGFPSRSMSRILWQDLTLTTTDTAIVEEEYTERMQSQESDSIRENFEIRKICKTSRKIFRQAWGKNSVKIFLFAKLVAGYFTVDRSGKLCKVNDWRHVSGEDLRYRENAIFELVCLNQLQVEIIDTII